MAQTLESLEPGPIWQIFAGIAAVPRPSKQEERIRAHVKRFAESKGLNVKEEPVGNLIIDVPARPGKEKAPITVLQAHLDMVCEKNRGTNHDFDKDGIRLKLSADEKSGEPIVVADGTTLGADNGIGVSLALAAATDPSVVHGPLELLFTVDEEAGMGGAKALTPKSFRGRRLINLDSEEDDSVYIGCAGGCDVNLAWSLATSAAPADMKAARVTVEGARGGHSGGDIHENRANAIKLLARVLIRAGQGALRLAEITGGSKRNAIPREAHAVVACKPDAVSALNEAAKAVAAEAKAESFEDGISISVAPVSAADAGPVATAECTDALIAAMLAMPSGVIGMHPKVPNLVQTSNNLSMVNADREGGRLNIAVGCLSRSSSDSLLELTTGQLAAVGRLSGAVVSFGNEYPGWEPDVDSPTLAVCKRVYEKHFGHAPKILAIHAGLECGIIGQRVGKMDMVSFGPRITGAHSPDERVYVDSVGKSWNYLRAVLAELAG